MIYDPVLTDDVVGQQVPVAKFVDYWAPLFGLDATTMDTLHKKAASCGYTSYFEKNLVYPPKGPFPPAPKMTDGCDVWSLVFEYVSRCPKPILIRLTYIPPQCGTIEESLL